MTPGFLKLAAEESLSPSTEALAREVLHLDAELARANDQILYHRSEAVAALADLDAVRSAAADAQDELRAARAELAKVRETTESLRVCAEGWKADCLKAQRELAEERNAKLMRECEPVVDWRGRAEKAEADAAKLRADLSVMRDHAPKWSWNGLAADRERLTRELAETEAKLAISTRRLESASQERDHHLNALVAARMEIAALKTGGAS